MIVPLVVAAACSGGSGNPLPNAQAVKTASTQSHSLAGGDLSQEQFATGAAAGTAPDAAQYGPVVADARNGATTTSAIDPLSGRDLVYTANMTLRVSDIGRAATSIDRVANSVHGFISDEQLDAVRTGTRGGAGTVTIRVPQKSFDAALHSLAELGTQVNLSRSVNDVTDQTIDVSSRLSTQRASITRIRTLMAHANDLGQVISLESELTQREGQLESLERRLHALNREVALSTISVNLELRSSAHHHHARHHHHGFLGGLYSGWDAFVDVVTGLLTAVGAALPFIGALIVLIALAMALRRRRVGPSSDVT